MNVKQVIVMRKKFPIGPNGEMRKIRTGKMIAQGAHASMAVIINSMRNYVVDGEHEMQNINIFGVREMSAEWKEWINGRFTKVCLGVDTEKELLDIVDKAKLAGLPHALITDAGLTEFNGVPTNTCMAIGPAKCEDIDAITGALELL